MKIETVKLGDIFPRKHIVWDKSHVDMTDDVVENYDINKGVITVSSDNKVLDGNHRYEILANRYGCDHEIQIDRKPYKRYVYAIRFWVLFLFTWPFLIIYTLIKGKK